MKLFRFEIITRAERHGAMQQISAAITAAEGWIVHHQLFSNISASITFEVDKGRVPDLLAKLENDGFNPVIAEGADAATATMGQISITFIHDEPDMKRDVPAFG